MAVRLWRTVIHSALPIAAFVLLLVMGVRHYSSVQPIVYADHLTEVAVSVDGEELTLRDLSFYVLYEEQIIESEAYIYNNKNTRDYWNLHANGIFFKSAAKKCVMDMAVHDRLFYREAVAEGIKLTDEERRTLEESYGDFVDDLFLQQLDSPLFDRELIYDTMEQIALGEKYRAELVKREGVTYAGYGYDGYEYKQYLSDHSIRINKRIWERVSIGDNSLAHKSANAINGQEYDR